MDLLEAGVPSVPSRAIQDRLDMEAKPSAPRPRRFERHVQPCVAELLGSALFIFIGCLAVLEEPGGTGHLQPALAHGLALAVTVAVLGDISGGHLNPAVSLAVWLLGGLPTTMLIPYWLSQLCGGAIGAGLAKAVAPSEHFGNASGAAFVGITAGEQVPAVLGAEIVLSSFLLLVVCMGTVNGRTSTPLAPLCIGLAVTADILAGGGVSGACMNPARAFGPALVANCWDYHWVYWVGPMVAALLVGALVRLLMGDQATRLLLK
ncbi:aquaporin-8 [Onychostruthus taczanowskii]|uniref:aquaporin-8 n=1 Tax=Onychostruthus taczanowskii TaxID=356909 RepID=UPI001B7FF631|nr:aquaporin-8 [Onychostruthus taczanowskii]